MDEVHPVLFLHTVPWCKTCINLTKPESWNVLTNLIESINPSTEIRVIQHVDYQTLNKDTTKIYPRVIKQIHTYPCFIIQPSNLANKEGNMEGAYIYKAKFDRSTGFILPDENKPDGTMKDWLSKHLLQVQNNKREEKNINPELMKKLMVSDKNESNRNVKSEKNTKNNHRKNDENTKEYFFFVRYRKPF